VAVLTLRTAGGQRLWGAVVFVGCALGAVTLALTGGAPWLTWLALGIFGGAAGVASVANFGDRWSVDDEGLAYRNVLTGRLGWPRQRRAAWDDVLSATEHEGRTWFVEVEGQRRWVLDHVDAHDELQRLFEAHGVSVRQSRLPRPFRRRSSGSPDEG
jgi:hypothetical protein